MMKQYKYRLWVQEMLPALIYYQVEHAGYFLRDPYIDTGIKGNNKRTLYQFAQYMMHQKRLNHIPDNLQFLWEVFTAK